ncbi:addiction module protein [Coraliomargarita sp. SDUM461003]|uniref:Addiction module protein n=1 Tax=Thalassobacterium maritimum TaxID=3041265 RepID=A0ABU1AQS5_9BACT|nr:addiction module protein [Coraliomargarita sp. SDUM461003]MDQ8206488.1 addiction module protein [Coraliomargarita sp. SDUM461003]
MSVSLKVESELMGLPPVERAMLAERLLSSFDSSEQTSLDVEWCKEAENRIEAFDNGLLSASKAEDVHARIEKKYF